MSPSQKTGREGRCYLSMLGHRVSFPQVQISGFWGRPAGGGGGGGVCIVNMSRVPHTLCTARSTVHAVRFPPCHDSTVNWENYQKMD